MRDLSTTLLAAQQKGFVKALVKLVLTHGATTYTYTKARILDVTEKGNGNLQSLVVILDNSDKTLTDLDLRGYKGVLSYGIMTAAGEEYSSLAPMWIMPQQFDSNPNKLICTLSLVGICNMMADDKASESYVPEATDTKTVKTLIREIVGDTGVTMIACFNHCQKYDIVFDSEDDLIDTYKPKDGFRIYERNNRLSAINRLLDYTKCVMRAEDDGKIHIFVPTTSGTTYDSEYSLESGHPFFSKALRNRLVIPNYIKVHSRPDDDPQYSGTATDAESYALLPKPDYFPMLLESNAQATKIAQAKIAMAQLWSEGGAASVPLNVGTEVYDYVKVTDEREDDYRIGNIGTFTRHYNVTKNEWEMSFTFGNWQTVRKALANLGVTSDDLENYFSRLSVGDLYVEHIYADSLDMVWLDPEGNIDLSKIGDTLDNLPDGEIFARIKTVHLDAEGGLKMDENVWYKPGYDPNTKKRNFTSTPTTPYDLGDMWTDGTVLKRCTTARATGAYVAGDWTQVSIDQIGDGSLYHRVKSAALSADGLVLLDQVTVGTYGLIKSAALDASGLVLLDQVVDGTYGKLLATQIQAGKIYISSATDFATGYDPSGKSKVFRQASDPTAETVGDLWVDTDDKNKLYRWSGTSWVSVRDSDIPQALADAAEAYAYADDAYDLAGIKARTFRQTSAPTSGMQTGDIWIDTDNGNKPYIYSGSAWIAAYTQIDGGNITTGTINCQVVTIQTDSSGDRVVLNSAGVIVYGDSCFRVYYSTSEVGLIGGYSGGIGIASATGKEIQLTGNATGAIVMSFAQYVSMTTCNYLVIPTRTSDPSVTNGGMYYNTSTGEFRVCRQGAWRSIQVT